MLEELPADHVGDDVRRCFALVYASRWRDPMNLIAMVLEQVARRRLRIGEELVLRRDSS